MIMNGVDAENLPLSQKQTCLNKVHEIALYVFRRMQLKMHSINHLVKNCTQVLGYFWITVSADWAELPLLSPEKQWKHSIFCGKSLWTLKEMTPSREAKRWQGSSIYTTREKWKFVCNFLPLHNEWQVCGQSSQSLSKGKLFDMMLMFVCSDFRNICQHTW